MTLRYSYSKIITTLLVMLIHSGKNVSVQRSGTSSRSSIIVTAEWVVIYLLLEYMLTYANETTTVLCRLCLRSRSASASCRRSSLISGKILFVLILQSIYIYIYVDT